MQIYGNIKTAKPEDQIQDKSAARSQAKQHCQGEDDGSMTITKVEIKLTSSGRERFGSGTKNWGKYPLDTPCLEQGSAHTGRWWSDPTS